MNIQLPVSPSNAELPAVYESAVTAMANCHSIDECKAWKDKAAALASYARMAENEALWKLATRIMARASRRAGTLLLQIEAQHGANQNIKVGDHLNVLSRKEAAHNAGMSDHQQKTAQRIANVSKDDFEQQVESEKPPSLTKLAKQGTKPRAKKKTRPLVDLNGRDPKAFNRALHFVGDFEIYAKEIEKIKLADALADLTSEERIELRKFITRIDVVHDKIREMI